MRHLKLSEWVDAAPKEDVRQFRQAVHIVLLAISEAPTLPKEMVMKGGILLAIAHAGDRFTRDIDFSTRGSRAELPPETIFGELEGAIALAVDRLAYDLDCRIQSKEVRPPDETKSFPTLILKVGYARRSHPASHRRLIALKSPQVVKVECSYNEIITSVEVLEVAPGLQVQAYDLTDMVAEKLRALLQQEVRDRYRRQDVYDLFKLLEQHGAELASRRTSIHAALIAKSASRDLDVGRSSLRQPELLQRAKREYETLAAEIDCELPDFTGAMNGVCEYYESLPWEGS